MVAHCSLPAGGDGDAWAWSPGAALVLTVGAEHFCLSERIRIEIALINLFHANAASKPTKTFI